MSRRPLGDLVTCRDLGCHNRRARPGASHCRQHEVEWHAIEREQQADLIARGDPNEIRPEELADLKAAASQ